MGDKTYYTYEGKKKRLASVTKYFNDLVLLEEDWLNAIHEQIKEQGYGSFLKYVKFTVRQACSIDLTDAQAWLLLHDLTNDGVPMSQRDVENDEDANAAKILKGAVNMAVNAANPR